MYVACLSIPIYLPIPSIAIRLHNLSFICFSHFSPFRSASWSHAPNWNAREIWMISFTSNRRKMTRARACVSIRQRYEHCDNEYTITHKMHLLLLTNDISPHSRRLSIADGFISTKKWEWKKWTEIIPPASDVNRVCVGYLSARAIKNTVRRTERRIGNGRWCDKSDDYWFFCWTELAVVDFYLVLLMCWMMSKRTLRGIELGILLRFIEMQTCCGRKDMNERWHQPSKN